MNSHDTYTVLADANIEKRMKLAFVSKYICRGETIADTTTTTTMRKIIKYTKTPVPEVRSSRTTSIIQNQENVVGPVRREPMLSFNILTLFYRIPN